MMIDFNRVFNPSIEEKEKDKRFIENIRKNAALQKTCTTCSNCTCPSSVMIDEWSCSLGMECNALVKDCPSYREGL